MKRGVNVVAILVYTILILFVFALLWMYFSRINVVIRVQGQVEPYSQIQVVDHLEGGMLKKINVEEGDKVKEGEVLAVLERHTFSSKHEKARTQKAVLTAEVARLKAEAKGLDEVPFPEGFEQAYPNIAEQSRQLFERNKDALNAKLDSLKETKQLSEHELKIIQPLVEKQIISKVEELRLKRKLSQVKGKIKSRKHDFRAEAHRQLTNKKAELAKAKHTLDLSKNKLEALKIRAPTNGIIKRVHANTKGAAIQPGEKVVEIVPMDKHPIIRAKVRTKDLGYIEKGLPAQVTFSAQSTTQYATVPAKIVYISPDSEEGDDGNLYYEIKLETERDKFRSKSGTMIPIQSGMSVTIAVQVGERSLLGSLLTPLFETMESALENP